MPFSVVQLSCIGTQIRNPSRNDKRYGSYHNWRCTYQAAESTLHLTKMCNLEEQLRKFVLLLETDRK